MSLSTNITITAAKLPSGSYRVSLAYRRPSTTRHFHKAFNVQVNPKFRLAPLWTTNVILGAALRVFAAIRVEDIDERYTARGLGSLLFNFLKRMSKRKGAQHLLQKYESEGRIYAEAQKAAPGTITAHGTGAPQKPTNSGTVEGDGALAKGEPLDVQREIEARAVPIPPKSIFTPEETGVTYAMVGKSFSGKTTFLVNELNKLTEKDLLKYNVIIFFTESAHAKPLKDLAPHVRGKMVLVDRFVPKVLQALKKINDELACYFKALIIYDDIIQLRGMLLTKTILTLRNSNISSAISIQYEKLLSPAQRSSLHNIWIFNLRVPSWEFFLQGFLIGNVKELLPSLKDEKSIPVVAQKLRSSMDSHILYYNQRTDQIALWQKFKKGAKGRK